MSSPSTISFDSTFSTPVLSSSATESTQSSSDKSTISQEMSSPSTISDAASISFTSPLFSSSSVSLNTEITTILSTIPDIYEVLCDFVTSCLPENNTLLLSQPLVVANNIIISSSNSINDFPINSSEKCQNPFIYQGKEYDQCISINGVLKCRASSGQFKECSKNQSFFLSNGTTSYKNSLIFDFPDFKSGFFEISFKTLMFCEGYLKDCSLGNNFIRLIGNLESTFRQSEALFDIQYSINDIQNDFLWKEKKNRFFIKNSGNLKLTIELGREKTSQNDVFIGFDGLKISEKKMNPNQVQDKNILLLTLLAFCISAAIISIVMVFLFRRKSEKKKFFANKNLNPRYTVQF
ncbi:hypothetical protein BpHYR1_040695 [Brachionus plicatilis]|uniref:Uncharacterized protein n=1 Tax=Brachionus plicatilis TaxID=10195 RepID=A0A3M7P8H3_BRAPC|nr:hypothetical protein BpHYR1_040695 [Brachionus plicatilis]